MHSTEGRFVIGPSNILFGGVYVCTFQPRNITGWGSEGVNSKRYGHLGTAAKCPSVTKVDIIQTVKLPALHMQMRHWSVLLPCSVEG